MAQICLTYTFCKYLKKLMYPTYWLDFFIPGLTRVKSNSPPSKKSVICDPRVKKQIEPCRLPPPFTNSLCDTPKRNCIGVKHKFGCDLTQNEFVNSHSNFCLCIIIPVIILKQKYDLLLLVNLLLRVIYIVIYKKLRTDLLINELLLVHKKMFPKNTTE